MPSSPTLPPEAPLEPPLSLDEVLARARANKHVFLLRSPSGDAVLLVEGRIYRNSHGVPTGTVNGPFSGLYPYRELLVADGWKWDGDGAATGGKAWWRPASELVGTVPDVLPEGARLCQTKAQHSHPGGRWKVELPLALGLDATGTALKQYGPKLPPGIRCRGNAFVAQTHVNNETRWSTPSSDLLEAIEFRDEMLQAAKVERAALRSQKTALRHGRSASENSKIALERIEKRRLLPKGVLRTDSGKFRAQWSEHGKTITGPVRALLAEAEADRAVQHRASCANAAASELLAMQTTLRPPTPLAPVNA